MYKPSVKGGVFMTPGYTDKKDFFSFCNLNNRCSRIYAAVFICLLLSAGGLYLRFAWNRYQDIASSESISLAHSIASLLHIEHVSALTGTEKDLQKPEYIMTKLSLQKLVKTNDMIRFAYLMGNRNGSMIFLVDSEEPGTPEYSPPGEVYYEATDTDWLPFKSGSTVLTNAATDRWGRWVSALVPIKNPSTGKIIAVLGIDYPASEWYAGIRGHMIPDIIVVITLLFLFWALFRACGQHSILKELSEKLAFKEALYRSVFEQAPIGIAILNDRNLLSKSEYGEININPMFEQIIGRKNNELTSVKWTDITHHEDLQADLDKFEQFQAGEIESYSIEKRFLRPDGTSIWTNKKVAHLLGFNDKMPVHLCLLEDISVRKAAEEDLKESERSKSVLLSHLPGMAYRCKLDREWTMEYVSDGCLELTGYPPESLLNNKDISYNDLINPEYRGPLWNEWQKVLPVRMALKYEYEIITADGKKKWVLDLAEGNFDKHGKAETIEGIVIDISERKKIEDELRYNINHDRLTGLFNRYYFENLLNREIYEKNTCKMALVGINLRTIQSLTTAYGFNYTQKLVKIIADELACYCMKNRLLFYTYDNRFLFYIKKYKDKKELLEFTDAVIDKLEHLLSAERVGGGIGIVEIEYEDGLDADKLLKKLLIASEKAISIADKNFYVNFFDKDMEREIIREQEIKLELSCMAADENDGGLFLQYQPILDLKSDRICGFEALARLNSKKLGLVPPLEFIPIAEKTRLIIPVGQKIIVNALLFLNKLNEKGFTSVSVSINVSAIQIMYDNFVENLLDIINKMHVNPENICIEITESAFSAEYEDINRVLGKLRKIGIHVAIDDLGTGYSSLARERELNIDCVKIDKYFIDKLLYIQPCNAITADIISMAHKMGHYVIAEGVEHEKQKQYLLNNGCEKIQGYLVSRPLYEDAAIEILIKQINTNNGYIQLHEGYGDS